MKYLLIILMIMPFGLLSQTNVIEPELHSDIKLAFRDSIYEFSEYNGLVFVNADDSIHGLELWVFDENINSLRMLKDINPNGDSNPLIVSNELDEGLLFYANDENGIGLWITDGTTDGTKILKYLVPIIKGYVGAYTDDYAVYRKINEEIFFAASESDTENYELWKTDGTTEGTKLVKEINSDGASYPMYLHVISDRLVFKTSGKNTGIWSTDGTEENTIKLSDSTIGSDHDLNRSSRSSNNYFFTQETENKPYLTSTDGTEEGTFALTDKFDGFRLEREVFSLFRNTMYFYGHLEDGSLVLCLSDGTIEGTKMVKNLSVSTKSGLSFLTYSRTNGQKLFFYLYENGNNSMWVTDGTEQGTIKVTPNGMNKLSFNTLSSTSDKVYFSNFDEVNGEELWVSDGTISGTYFVKNFSNSAESNNINYKFGVFYDKALFTIKDKNDKILTWVTDGTESGTSLLSPNLMNISRLISDSKWFNEFLIFTEISHDNTIRMWQTDMTKEGTNIIMPLDQNNNNHVDNFTSYQIEFKNYIYFFAEYYGDVRQLYRMGNTITSVEQQEPQTLLTLYPNPAEDFVQIDISKPMQLSIISSTGAVVKDCGIVADGKVQVSELSAGVYFIVDDNGNNIAKFIKE